MVANTKRSSKKAKWPHGNILPGVFDVGNGQWGKKINGKRHYLGQIEDPSAALQTGLSLLQAHANGEPLNKPRIENVETDSDQATIEEVFNRFVEDKIVESLAKEDSISPVTRASAGVW